MFKWKFLWKPQRKQVVQLHPHLPGRTRGSPRRYPGEDDENAENLLPEAVRATVPLNGAWAQWYPLVSSNVAVGNPVLVLRGYGPEEGHTRERS
jgi:hypothetical protein